LKSTEPHQNVNIMRNWGVGRSLLALAPLLLGAPFIAYKIHYGMMESAV
jgi:hypothetical protein